jgi:hypothetical protein
MTIISCKVLDNILQRYLVKNFLLAAVLLALPDIF